MATTSSNSHNHPVKVGSKTYQTGSIGHQHTVDLVALETRVAALEADSHTHDEPDPGPDPEPPDPPEPTPGEPAFAAAIRAKWTGYQIIGTHAAPTTIPHDGVTASSSALQSWIDAQPNGPSDRELRVYDLGTIGGTLVLNGGDVSGIDLRGKSNIILKLPKDGLIRQTDASGSTERQAFLIGNGSMVWVDGQNCAVDSENPLVGNPANIDIGRSALQFRSGGRYLRASNIRWLRQWGFGPWASSSGGSASPEDLWLHDCYVEGGQMGLAVVGAKRLVFERITLKDTMRIAMDIEPDAASDAIEDILLQRITADGWGNDPAFSSWFFSAVPSGQAEQVPMKRVTVQDCVSLRSPKDSKNGNYAGIGGLAIRCDDPNPKEAFTITGNATDRAHNRSDAVMRFRAVTGLTVTGNTQVLNSGTLVSSVP